MIFFKYLLWKKKTQKNVFYVNGDSYSSYQVIFRVTVAVQQYNSDLMFILINIAIKVFKGLKQQNKARETFFRSSQNWIILHLQVFSV